MGTALDRFLRGNKSEQHDGLLKNCLFRESLDIEDIDKEMFDRMSNDKTKLIAMIKKMFRPHLNIQLILFSIYRRNGIRS